MKKLFKLLVICLLNVSLLMAQNGKDTLPKIYEGCCGTKPYEFSYGNAKVFIPNVFTPNGDGLNDIFMPFISNDIIEVQDYSILCANGDTLLFSRPTFKYDEYEKYAWNGNRFTGSGVFASEYIGMFKYGMRLINAAGRSQVLEGEACVIRCGKEAKVFKNRDGCFYADQAEAVDNKGNGKGNGKLDKTKKTAEKDCY